MSSTSRVALELPSRAFARRRHANVPEASTPDRGELAERLRSFPLFAELPPARLHELVSSTRVRVHSAGDLLWRQGQTSRWVLFIEAGLAITSRTTRWGLTRTYGLYGPGDSLGVYAIWTGMKYPTDALALNHGLTVLAVSAAALLRLAKAEPLLTEPLLAEIGRFTESFIRKIDIVSAGTVPRRVATLMLMLLERYGVSVGDNAVRLPIRMTLEQIGALTDARIETVARALAEWKRQGWLSNDAEGFVFTAVDRLEGQLGG